MLKKTGKVPVVALLFCAAALAQSDSVMKSSRAKADVAPDTNPSSGFWRGAPSVTTDTDKLGKAVPDHKTEIRSRWTKDNLYLLFICHFDKLYMKPDPVTSAETNKLWDWDVAEAFIGNDPDQIRRYKEFEISPQGEWVDLDINGAGISWDSHFQVATKIDKDAKVWYGVMRIPYNSIDTRPASAGNKLRINLYRQQGPPEPERVHICWRPTGKKTFHVPESFGTIELVD